MKNIRVFLSENFQFLEVKFSIYLNRRVYIMDPLSARVPCICMYTCSSYIVLDILVLKFGQIYIRTSMARTFLKLWTFVLDMIRHR